MQTPAGIDMHRKAMKKRNKLPYYQRRKTKRNRDRDTQYGRTEYREWRIKVLGRDKFTCQECGKTGGILQAHHIKAWADHPKLRHKIDNGLTLCVGCHSNIHGFATLTSRKCPVCNNTFAPHNIKQETCSIICAGIKRRKLYNHQCSHCKRPFTNRIQTRKFCSHRCYGKSLKTIPDKKCATCDTIFSTANNNRIYCSRKCFNIRITEKAKKVCPTCKEKYSPSHRKQVCCSKPCADIKRRK